MPGEKDRRTLLDASAQTLGAAWALGARKQLSAEGRNAVGGWPGTMSEARERTRRALASDSVVRQLGKLGYPEIERTARAMYARARQVWLETAERGDDADGSVG
jgi:hypothetical protein